MGNTSKNLIWMDGEFTGLDYSKNRLLEAAVVVTDSQLNILGEPVSVVIYCDPTLLDELLEDWPREHFAGTDFFDQITQSSVTMEQAEQQILKYVSQYTEPGASPLCGNSVGGDRRMLEKDMPRFAKYLHYRNIDVSSIKELAKRWNSAAYNQVVKKKTHRALDDIYESIAELKTYREHFLKAT